MKRNKPREINASSTKGHFTLFYQQNKNMNSGIVPWKGNFSCGYSTDTFIIYLVQKK